MDIYSLVTFLAVGTFAGWLASHLLRTRGFGPLGNIAIGIVGAMVGGFSLMIFGIISTGIIGSVVSATVGSALFLAVGALVKKL